MKPSRAPEHDEQNQDIIRILQELGPSSFNYPAELSTATRQSFLEQLDRLETEEGFAPEDQEIVEVLHAVGMVREQYPANQQAARRLAFVDQLERVSAPGLLDRLRSALQGAPDLRRFALSLGGLAVALLLGVIFFSRTQTQIPAQVSPTQAVSASTQFPSSPEEIALLICEPGSENASCPSAMDLAESGQGAARPAVAKDAHADGDHRASYVNDGRRDGSWVSESADSWIKIDLGQARTINTVSLQRGNAPASGGGDPGQFSIAVALNDVYADGDSQGDDQEYAQVFQSEPMGFSGTVSEAATLRSQFPAIQARFVKITFEKAGASIQEIGVFLVEPSTPGPAQETVASTQMSTTTSTATLAASPTSVSTGTAISALTTTPTAAPTYPPAPTATWTFVPTEPLPSETPLPPATIPPPTNEPPTSVPPTEVPPTDEPPPTGGETIVITGNRQTMTFTCNGAAEIRGHENTITLLGSCSSITVTGNGNHVFWESGSPVITNNGNNNIVEQM